jgi:hypothetical protein
MALQLNPTTPRPESETRPLVDRERTNPMFNDQKMKLGLFGTNCSYGLIMSHAPSTYEVTWEHTKKIALRAEELGFEALVPIARWRGFGGSTYFYGNCFETYTWAAGRIGCHAPSSHASCAGGMPVSKSVTRSTSPVTSSRSSSRNDGRLPSTTAKPAPSTAWRLSVGSSSDPLGDTSLRRVQASGCSTTGR